METIPIKGSRQLHLATADYTDENTFYVGIPRAKRKAERLVEQLEAKDGHE